MSAYLLLLDRRMMGGLALALALSFPFAAWAADTANTTVDLSGLAATAIALVAGLLAAIGRTAVKALAAYLQQRAKLELDDHTRSYLDAALDRAVVWARGKIEGVADGALQPVDLHNAAIALAARYAVERVPDALAHFGVTQEALGQMIEARMASWAGGLIGSTTVRDGATVQDGPAATPAATPA